MSTPVTIQRQVEDYLAERRRLGFELRKAARLLTSFARSLECQDHQGPLTVEVMADWARCAQGNGSTRTTWARRLKQLRPFARWLQQFDPRTEVPDGLIFGGVDQRLAPHIYTEQEILDLLAAARRLAPTLRGATYETLFGLLASTGLRVSEAVHLMDADVDLKSGLLLVRQTKFAKSRQVPLHPSTVAALRAYRSQRNRQLTLSAEPPFFVGTRGRRRGSMLSAHQVERVFQGLRNHLAWSNRGAHPAPRIHDLRHTFAVRRLLLWHEDGTDLDQAMLALATYLGHAKISHTYWYLTGVPELMAIAGGKFERFAQSRGADDD